MTQQPQSQLMMLQQPLKRHADDTILSPSEPKRVPDWTNLYPPTPQQYFMNPLYQSTPITGMHPMPMQAAAMASPFAPVPFMSPAEDPRSQWQPTNFFPQGYGMAPSSMVMQHQQPQQQQQELPHDESGSSNESGVGMTPEPKVLAYNEESEGEEGDGGGGEGGALQPYSSISFCPKPIDSATAQAPFMIVPGRLNLMNFHNKYTVTIGEIMRRVSPPECLNSSILGAILRKAKTKKGGSDMRDELAEKGIQLPPGRRKANPITSFTALIEEEAQQLGNDLDEVISRHFPSGAIAAHLFKKVEAGGPGAVQQRLIELQGFMTIMSELCTIVHEVKSPLGKSNPPRHPDENLQMTFNNFSLHSHGLAPIVMRSAAMAFLQAGKMYRGSLDSPFTRQQQQSMHSQM